MSKICQLVPRNRNESDTLSRNIPSIAAWEFRIANNPGSGPAFSPLKLKDRLPKKESERGHWRFPVRHRRHREVRVSSVTMTTTTRIHLTAENTTATATTDFSAAAAHFQISPTLHSCHNDPGKNPPDNRRLRRPTDRPTKCLVSRWRRREGQLGRLPLPVGDSRSLSLTSLRISHASTVKAKSQRDLPNGPAAGRLLHYLTATRFLRIGR